MREAQHLIAENGSMMYARGVPLKIVRNLRIAPDILFNLPTRLGLSWLPCW